MYTLNEYQADAMRTAKYGDEIRRALQPLITMAENEVDDEFAFEDLTNIEKIMRLSYVMAGLAGEAAETCNKFKKIIRDDGCELTNSRKEQLIKELGGVLWYVAAFAHELDISMEDIAYENIDQLTSRVARGVISGDGDDR